jgi:hypothetical protein
MRLTNSRDCACCLDITFEIFPRPEGETYVPAEAQNHLLDSQTIKGETN